MQKISYRRLYKYCLDQDYKCQTLCTGEFATIGPLVSPWIELRPDGVIFIKKGYSWDGPSGPARDTANFMRSSLVHDALYQLIEEKKIPKRQRKNADKTMRQINKEDGMKGFRRWYTYTAVRWFGGTHV